MIDEWCEKARKIAGAQRVARFDYQEPFVKLRLVFLRWGYEQEVASVIDLSSGEDKIRETLYQMHRHAEYHLQRKRNGGK